MSSLRRSARIAAKNVSAVSDVPKKDVAVQPEEVIVLDEGYDSDCSIDSSMTEYCLTRNGLRKRNMSATHRDIVRHTKDGTWWALAYD